MLVTVMVAAARSALDDGGDSHASGGADRDQSALRACVAGEDLGERREDPRAGGGEGMPDAEDRKSTRLNSSHGYISYAVFCLKKKKTTINNDPDTQNLSVSTHEDTAVSDNVTAIDVDVDKMTHATTIDSLL